MLLGQTSFFVGNLAKQQKQSNGPQLSHNQSQSETAEPRNIASLTKHAPSAAEPLQDQADGLADVPCGMASECETEYPESDISLDACHPDAAVNFDIAKRTNESGLQPTDQSREMELACKPIDRSQSNGARTITHGKDATSLNVVNVAPSTTQYPDTEDIEGLDAYLESDVGPAEPDPQNSTPDAPPAEKGIGKLGQSGPGSSQPLHQQQEEAVSETQYPELDEEDSAEPETHARRQHVLQTSAQAENVSDPAPADENGDLPTETQYPDLEEESDVCKGGSADGGEGPAPTAERAFPGQPVGGSPEPVEPDEQEREPAGTQYPDLDDDDMDFQPDVREPEAAAGSPHDAQADFDAELDQFLAEQV